MTVKSADLSTPAPRLSHVEDLAQWLKDRPASGGGLTDDIKKLWRDALRYSSPTLTEDPWTQTSAYQTAGTSISYCVFSESVSIIAAMSAKPLYGWLFSAGDTR